MMDFPAWSGWAARALRILSIAGGTLCAAAAMAAAPEHVLLVGTWRVDVADGTPRELQILDAEPAKGGEVALDARFGRTGKHLKKVSATLVQREGESLLVLETPSAGTLRVRREGDDRFVGTLEKRSGKKFPAKLVLLENFPPRPATEHAAAASHADEEDRADLKPGAIAYPKDASIQLVYMGGNDCPPCVVWQRLELPKLQAAAEMASVPVHKVIKTIQSPVPVAWLPKEIQPLGEQLLEASGGQGGSSQAALVVNGKVADYWFGYRSAEDIVAMVKAVRLGQPLPGNPCLKWSLQRLCLKTG